MRLNRSGFESGYGSGSSRSESQWHAILISTPMFVCFSFCFCFCFSFCVCFAFLSLALSEQRRRPKVVAFVVLSAAATAATAVAISVPTEVVDAVQVSPRHWPAVSDNSRDERAHCIVFSRNCLHGHVPRRDPGQDLLQR